MRRHDHAPNAIDEVLEEAHTAIALLGGTLVASPVLLAALSGRQDVLTALGLYVAAIVGCWVVVGLLGGAISLVGARTTTTHGGDEPIDTSPGAAASAPDPSREPDPATSSR